MFKSTHYFRPTNLETIWKEWLVPAKYHEPVMIVTPYASDYVRRLTQLVEQKSFVKKELGIKNAIDWIIGDYREDAWGSMSQLINKQGKSRTTILLVLGFEKILADKRVDLILELLNLYRKEDVRIICVHEGNYYGPQNEELLASLPNFSPRIVYFPLYSTQYANEFIYYLCNKWKLTLEAELIEKIAKTSGGSLLLVKTIVWYIRDHNVLNWDEINKSTELLWQLKCLWGKLSKEEQDYFRSFAFKLTMGRTQPMVRDYLEKTGLTNVPLLIEFVINNEKNPRQLALDQNKLMIAGEDYSRYFTKIQRVILQELITNNGMTVTREQLIEHVWGDSEVGSDWALDSQINRLRNKLKELGIGERKIITKRNKGYLWLG